MARRKKDAPAIPDTGSQLAHVGYWVLVAFGGLILQLAILALISGP